MNPDFHYYMSAAEYFSDPCPAPSLTQSVAKILLDKSPLHAWHAHPKLNPDFRADDDTKFDIGNVAHKMLLGRGKEIAVLEGFDDWRTKAAKEAREEAAAGGKLAVLGKHAARADRMVTAAREQLNNRGLGHLFSEVGNSEVVVTWNEGNIWFRQMLDWVSSPNISYHTVADYKTSDMSAAPHGLGRMMVNAGWPVQAAFAERGLDVLSPETAGRRQFLFIVQEAEVPYALSVVRMSEGTMTMGRKQVARAVDIWSRCIEANRWPGYPADIVIPEYPSWHESAVLEREVEHHERRAREPLAADHFMGG